MELKKIVLLRFNPFQWAGGTPTVPWIMAYPRSKGIYKIYRSSVSVLSSCTVSSGFPAFTLDVNVHQNLDSYHVL